MGVLLFVCVCVHAITYYTHVFGLVTRICRDRGSTVVKVLCYKSEDRWFDLS